MRRGPRTGVAADGRHGFGAAVAVQIAFGGGHDGLRGALAVQGVRDRVRVGSGYPGAAGGVGRARGARWLRGGACGPAGLQEARAGYDGGHGGEGGEPVDGPGPVVRRGVRRRLGGAVRHAGCLLCEG